MILTKTQARKIILHAAGLAKRGQFGKGREAVYKLIDHLGFVQIDTNYVVERAHHHAIASRVPDYKREWLGELQEDGRIFEFMTFASGYMPIHDFRFSLPVKTNFLSKRKPLTPPEISLMKKVLDRIARDGPLLARDFENDRVGISSGWWDWRPSKVALERLYMDGSLMATRGKDFQKLYDLPKNIVPVDIDTTEPTTEEYARHVIRRSLKTLGVASIKDIAFRTKYVKTGLKPALEKLIDEGEVCEVQVTGLHAAPLYMLPAYLNLTIELSGEAFILSPFDVLNVDRRRLSDFFDFDYQIECFVPEPYRKYGYFSLPILIGDKFVARMDSKADRKKKALNIHNLHFEPIKVTRPMVAQLKIAIEAFTKFNQCATFTIGRSNDKQTSKALRP